MKFCGGCNPRYDRGAYFARVKAENPLCGFEIAEEEKQYDVLLVIGGCPSCCASCEQYHFERIVRVWEERSVAYTHLDVYKRQDQNARIKDVLILL